MSKLRHSVRSKFSVVYEINGEASENNLSRYSKSESCEKNITTVTTYASCSKDIQVYKERTEKHENQILESLKNSQCMVEHSMETGVATAKELHQQREQLERTKCCLSEINNDLRTNRKHITTVSSFFGGLKNYVSGKANKVTHKFTRTSREVKTIVQHENDDDEVEEIEELEESNVQCVAYRSKTFAEMDDFNDAVDCHLNKINNGLETLKGLAFGLGTELDSQNQLIDDINTQTEKITMEMKNQSKIVDKLLK